VPYLLRVELPDVPGSLGRVASALGAVGADIQALEIVGHPVHGRVVDDILLELPSGTLPDAVVSTCHGLDQVRVLYVNHYHAGGQLFMDLEVVEELTRHRREAVDRLVGMLPMAFRVDWAAKVRRVNGEPHVVLATTAAPAELPWTDVTEPAAVSDDSATLGCVVPLSTDEILVMGRAGGPAFLDSEVARIRHLVGLAQSIEG
jgi:hypothetical protein